LHLGCLPMLNVVACTCCLCRNNSFEGLLEFSTDLFDASTMERMAQHLSHLLAAAVHGPETALSLLDILSPEERQLTLHTFNDTASPYPSDLTVHQLFERAAEQSPSAVCLAAGSERITYAAVNAAANQLAHWLVSRGVAAGCAVGVSLPKCPQLYIALLAVLKAGGYYVPLDPELPAERAAFMLRQTGVRLLLAAASVKTAELSDMEVVVVDQGWQQFMNQPLINLQPRSGPADIAYCIFTSGSTGQPKVRLPVYSGSFPVARRRCALSCRWHSVVVRVESEMSTAADALQGVEVCHGGVVNLLHYYHSAMTPLDAGAMFFQTMPFIFDGSIMDIHLPLSMGCGIVVAPADDIRDPDIARRLIKEHSVAFLIITPSQFQVDGCKIHAVVPHHSAVGYTYMYLLVTKTKRDAQCCAGDHGHLSGCHAAGQLAQPCAGCRGAEPCYSDASTAHGSQRSRLQLLW
jgi:non-ribosomal peptide synthetase component F